MAAGGLLYVYVEVEGHVWKSDWPKAGSGAIVGDRGLVRISRRAVRAIERLDTTWDHRNKAVVLTERGKIVAKMLAAGRDVLSAATHR